MAIVEMEGRASARSSRRNNHKPVYASRTINHPGYINVVATRMLAPALERVIAEANADAGDDTEALGGLALLCERAERMAATSAFALARRAYEIRNLKSRATKATTADPFLMAGNTSLRDEEIIEVPAGLAAAEDRIRCSLELLGREMSDADIEEMAEDLMEFARCVIHGPEAEALMEAADVVAALEGEVVVAAEEQLSLEVAA